MAPLLGMIQMAAPVCQTAVGEGQGKAGSQKVARMQSCDHVQLQGQRGEAGSFGCPESSRVGPGGLSSVPAGEGVCSHELLGPISHSTLYNLKVLVLSA